MDGWTVCCNGVDIIVHFTGNDSQYSRTRIVVYFGGGIGLYNWCDILSVATDEVFARGVAPVCDWWDGLFLFCRVVWVYLGFINKNPTVWWDFFV